MSEVQSVLNSGLYVDPDDCEYCHAWPAFPCAFHRPREDSPAPRTPTPDAERGQR